MNPTERAEATVRTIRTKSKEDIPLDTRNLIFNALYELELRIANLRQEITNAMQERDALKETSK